MEIPLFWFLCFGVNAFMCGMCAKYGTHHYIAIAIFMEMYWYRTWAKCQKSSIHKFIWCGRTAHVFVKTTKTTAILLMMMCVHIHTCAVLEYLCLCSLLGWVNEWMNEWVFDCVSLYVYMYVCVRACMCTYVYYKHIHLNNSLLLEQLHLNLPASHTDVEYIDKIPIHWIGSVIKKKKIYPPYIYIGKEMSLTLPSIVHSRFDSQ